MAIVIEGGQTKIGNRRLSVNCMSVYKNVGWLNKFDLATVKPDSILRRLFYDSINLC